MNFKRFETQVPSEYQELTFISNNGTQYIDTGLKGSDLADCEIEIVMRNDTALTTGFNFNGTYLSGSTAQFGLVATSSSECRSSMNFGFADAISTTGLDISEFHTIYATNGLQKVDNAVVGTLNFGTLNNGRFLLFARTDPNATSGVNVCAAMSLKSFTVKRNNQYIRNMIPAKRKSDNTFGLYDTVNDVFYTNQGTGDFTGGAVVEPTWHDIPYYIHNTSTDTLTTLPADVYANDTTATVGLKGQMEQSGTPSPTTPIQPQECGERTGNLCPSYSWEAGQYANGVWDTTTPNRITSPFFAVEEGKQYTITINNGTKLSWINLNYFDSNKQWLGNRSTLGMAQFSTASQSETTPNMPTGSAYMRVTVRPYNEVGNITINDIPTSDIAVNEGSTAKPFEPYGYKIPISSANTTTPVYLGEVETTRRVKKLVLTGAESFFRDREREGSWRFYSDALISAKDGSAICSHFENIGTDGVNNSDNVGFCLFYKAQFGCRFPKSIAATVTDFKSYLAAQYAAGTPVCVWYVLATEETGIVNEPLRKIGDYADTVSGISIPTITGKDTFDVQTTLKPSEVTANYHGWHTGTVHERESGQWD